MTTILSSPAPPAVRSDADLVACSLGGDRDAFGAVVERYQRLVCSVCYAGTGNLARSEDLAQETFLAAWRQLSGLRDPAALRAWLCGIARNLVLGARRADGREPAAGAELLDAAEETPAEDALPAQAVITREEEGIMWRALERVPALYREPMVLFYREHQSVERVAAALEVSEDVARQRLSRGRKMLHEQVAAFVEGALERSAPGKVFTVAVIAALPALASTASAATTVGSAAIASGGSAVAAKGAGATMFSPLIGVLSGWLAWRSEMNLARTPRQRALVRRQTWIILGGTLAFVAAFALLLLPGDAWNGRPVLATTVGLLGALGFAAWLAWALHRGVEAARQIHAEERAAQPEAFANAAGRAWEYRSRITLLGLPLVHVRHGAGTPGAGPASGWIAVGDRAVGVLFAAGAFAVGGVSVGTVSAGVVSVGVVSVGVVSLGTLGLGLLAVGTVAAGWWALSGLCSVGWEAAASGGLASAWDFASGSPAFAAQVNNGAVRDFFAQRLPAGVFQAVLGSLGALAMGTVGWVAWRTRELRDKTEETHPQTAEGAESIVEHELATTTAEGTRAKRAVAMDHLRGFLAALVVAHHAVLAYHPYGPPAPTSLTATPRIWQAFPVTDAAKWPGIDLIVGFNDDFFMSLFFLVAGLFTWDALQRRGAAGFLRDRALRLGIPFLVAAGLLAPLAYVPTWLGTRPESGGWWAQWSALGTWPAGPAWFLWVLLAFGALAAASWKLAPHWAEGLGRRLAFAKERPWSACGLLVLASAVVYVPLAAMVSPAKWAAWGPFSVQTARVIHYALYFAVGIALGAGGIERGLLAADGRLARRWMLWMHVAMGAFALAVAAFIVYIIGAQKGEPSKLWFTLMNFGFVLSCAASCLATAA